MQCPLCGSENLDGADVCGACCASLTGATKSSTGSTSLDEKISRGSVAHLLPAKAVTVEETDTVGEVIALLARRNFGCALVTRGGKLVGIFTERDALRKIGSTLDPSGSEPVARFMTSSPEVLIYSDTIAFALNRMAVGDYRHIPIRRADGVLGVISVRDVLSYLTRHFPDLLEAGSHRS